MTTVHVAGTDRVCTQPPTPVGCCRGRRGHLQLEGLLRHLQLEEGPVAGALVGHGGGGGRGRRLARLRQRHRQGLQRGRAVVEAQACGRVG